MLKIVKSSLFEKLFEEIPEAIVLADGQGHILKVNREFCRVFGYAPEEVAGHAVDDLIAHDDLRTEAENITEAVAQGQKFTLEATRRRKDGTSVDVSLLALPIQRRNDGVIVFGIYRDISDRKRSEEALQESRRHLEEAYAQLERISNLDGLTAIPNRRYFEQFYDLEWRRLCRERRPLALIMIDIDFFKRYNDHFGHLAGDKCLKQVAEALQVVNRAGDLVARYGGEEFVAILSGTGLEDARRIAEKMRQRVKAQAIPHPNSRVANHITISLGIAVHVPEIQDDPRVAILKADQALYSAKAKGRDRVEVVT